MYKYINTYMDNNITNFILDNLNKILYVCIIYISYLVYYLYFMYSCELLYVMNIIIICIAICMLKCRNYI